jgi:hypothetical protein
MSSSFADLDSFAAVTLPPRISDVDERVRVLARTLMAGGVHPRPSNVDIKDILHVGWKRVQDVVCESEFTPWPAAHTHRCVCRTDFALTAAFVAHAPTCALWRVHIAAEAVEFAWRVQHHMSSTSHRPDASFRSPLPDALLLPSMAMLQALLPLPVVVNPVAIALAHAGVSDAAAASSSSSMSMLAMMATTPASSDGVRLQRHHAVMMHRQQELLMRQQLLEHDDLLRRRRLDEQLFVPELGDVAPATGRLSAELGDAIVQAAAVCGDALRAPPVCRALAARPLIASPDDLDPAGVTHELAASAAVAVRRRARVGETRREQLADAAREAARFNSELFEQRQRRGPFELDPHTSALQVQPARLMEPAAIGAAAAAAEQQSALRASHAAALRARLDAQRQAESDLRRLVVDRRHETLTGAKAPRRAVDDEFVAADADLRQCPALADFDTSAPLQPPARPMSAFFHWINVQRPLLAAEQPNLTAAEQSRVLGLAWRQLPQEVRAPFQDQALADKRRYEAAMVPWAMRQSRVQRALTAQNLLAERDVDFVFAYVPPPDSEEAQQLLLEPQTRKAAAAAAAAASGARSQRRPLEAGGDDEALTKEAKVRRRTRGDDDSSDGSGNGADGDDVDERGRGSSRRGRSRHATPATKAAPPTVSAAERKLRAQLAATPDALRTCCVCSGGRPPLQAGDERPEPPFDPTLLDFAAVVSPLETFIQRLDRRAAMAQRLLLTCSTCYQSFHASCAQYTTDTAMAVRDLILNGGAWQCNECKMCDTCGAAGDENKLLICDLCERAYHTYCMKPAMRDLPSGGWRCNACVHCVACGAKRPGGAAWACDFTLCVKCDDGRAKKLNCPVCLRVHLKRSEVVVPMVQCDDCKLWVHRGCTRLTEQQWARLDDDDAAFVCETCKPAPPSLAPASPTAKKLSF